MKTNNVSLKSIKHVCVKWSNCAFKDFKGSRTSETCQPSPTIAQILPLMLFLVSLQHMGKGDDAIRETLYHLRDLMDYAHLFKFDMNTIYMPNVHIDSGEMCSCKEFIAQELLKTLVSAEITDQDGAVESRTALRLLQHNIRFLLQNSMGEHCLKDKVMVRKINVTNQELTFIRRCFTFFQDWMFKCLSSSDF